MSRQKLSAMPILPRKIQNDTARSFDGPSIPPWHGIAAAAARRFHQICAARVSTVVGEHGLTTLQYGALFHLSRDAEETGLEQNILATLLNVDRNTASVLVEQLVKLGLIARQINCADRRSRLLNLTTKGKGLYARLFPAVSNVNAEVLMPLPPRERKQFMDLLIRVIEGNLVHQKAPPRRRRRKLSRPPSDHA
jgi:MarR family transcriptional regulator, lower aerobic nicotinate degradation pathway regulator